MTSGQAISPPTMPCESAAMSPACGAGQVRTAEAADVAGLLRQVGVVSRTYSGKNITSAGQDHADDVADLHLPGRSAEDVPDLQVLKHLAGDGRGDADDRGHAEDGRDALRALRADDHHGQRGDDVVASVRPEIGLFESRSCRPGFPTRPRRRTR